MMARGREGLKNEYASSLTLQLGYLRCVPHPVCQKSLSRMDPSFPQWYPLNKVPCVGLFLSAPFPCLTPLHSHQCSLRLPHPRKEKVLTNLSDSAYSALMPPSSGTFCHSHPVVWLVGLTPSLKSKGGHLIQTSHWLP